MKRGVIAINVVVIVALGLLVLIILATMLVQKTTTARNTFSACQETYKGTCMPKTECDVRGGGVISDVDCAQGSASSSDEGWVLVSFPKGGTVCCVT